MKLFFKHRVYWPKGILFKSENTFLDIMKSGTMRMPIVDPKIKKNIQTSEIALFRKYAQRIVLSFMIHRVLIPGVVLNPSQCGLGRPVNRNAEKNTIYIASILYMLLKRIYSGGEVIKKSETESVTVLGIPEGSYEDKKTGLASMTGSKSKKKNISNEKDKDNNDTNTDGGDDDKKTDENNNNNNNNNNKNKGNDVNGLLPSKITTDNKHINWQIGRAHV